MYGSYVIHHSHVIGEINGYAHDFCNQKLRENKNLFSYLHITCLALIFSLCLKT